MNVNKFCQMFLGAAVLSTALVGCVEPEEKDRGPIDHKSAQQAINESVSNIGESITNSLAFMEDSKLFSDNFNEYLGGGYTCESGDDEDCISEDPTPFSSDVSEPKAELIKTLNDYVFNQANVESETANAVTYLLKGSVVCAQNKDMEQDERSKCVKSVDDAQIRLITSSPGPGSADVSVKIGPNRISPVSFQFHPKMISATPNIGEIKKAVDYLAPLIDEDTDTSGFPKLATGELRLSVQQTGDKKLEAKIAITQAIAVSDGDWGLQLAASPEAFVITADGLAKTLKASLDLGAISALFPYTSSVDYEFDEDGNEIEIEQTEAPVMSKLNVGGLSGSALFDASKELLSLTNLGLGDKTSTLDLNDKRVLSVDLNKEDGRRFDIAITKPGEHTQIELSPAFDLRMVFAFAQVQSELSDLADWMKDEIMSIRFTGASPKFEMVGGDIKVLSGKLSLDAEKGGMHHVIEAGQCLMSSDEVYVESNEPVEPVEPGEDGEEEDYEAEETHPMDNIEIGTCG